jgi:uncharacterized membrane protein required for colicin V production
VSNELVRHSHNSRGGPTGPCGVAAGNYQDSIRHCRADSWHSLAGRYYDGLAALLFPAGATWANIAAYVIILLATLLVAGVVGWLIAKLVHFAMLGWLDRLVGFILGILIGGLLCAAILAIVAKYYPGSEAVISQSGLARFLMGGFPLLLALLPADFDFIRDFFATS